MSSVCSLKCCCREGEICRITTRATLPVLEIKDQQQRVLHDYSGKNKDAIRVQDRRQNPAFIANINDHERIAAAKHKEFYENIIVHFDLKGAPPRVSYFLELLALVARSGATGILIEWEDMFPWTGSLAMAKNDDAYSMNDVRKILEKARSLKLDIIPLVQTFGHLEWILKLEQFRKYRENDAFPQVVCLGDEEAVNIVKDALTQVIKVHKEFGIKFFHIGADEAFEFGACEKSKQWMSAHPPPDRQKLAVNHFKKIAQHVKEETNGAKVLAWHDMLKVFNPTYIADLKLGDLIEPVIWDYSENIGTMEDEDFKQLATNFPIVWASSAYKGANYPTARYIDIRHYEANNRAWINTKKEQERKFTKFRGIILTGWQRYDHMAALCEILPMGTPSMVLNIQVALMGLNKDQHIAREKAAQVLGCRDFHVGGLEPISNRCTNFTGFTVYSLFQGSVQRTLSHVEAELSRNHHIMGWLSPYNTRHNITQTWYLNQMLFVIRSLYSEVKSVEVSLRRELLKLFFENTVDEFIFLNIAPTLDKLRNYLDEIKRLSSLRTYPKRPFKI